MQDSPQASIAAITRRVPLEPVCNMPKYRWEIAEMARGYDEGAAVVHPHYLELQGLLIRRIGELGLTAPHIVDLGAGSGRLAGRFLDEFPGGFVTLVDRSEAFLEIARGRLDPSRSGFVVSILQDDWPAAIDQPVDAIVSMSAIHHLETPEKRALYQRCFDRLRPGGLFINGDEVRPDDPADYLQRMRDWGRHMDAVVAENRVTPPMAEALRAWQERNIDRFEEPRRSGDDCHDTVDVQLAMLRDAGFTDGAVPWAKGMWACLFARKPAL